MKVVRWFMEILSPSVDPVRPAIKVIERSIHPHVLGGAGLYQLSSDYVREVNRILGWDKFTLKDRRMASRSREMVRILLDDRVATYRSRRGHTPSEAQCVDMHNANNATVCSEPQYLPKD